VVRVDQRTSALATGLESDDYEYPLIRCDDLRPAGANADADRRDKTCLGRLSRGLPALLVGCTRRAPRLISRGNGRLRCPRFSVPDRSGHLLRDARRHPRRRARGIAPVDAGRHTDQFGEATAEGAQRRAADRETDLGDAEVATTEQRHRALDAPRHQIAVRRLAVGEPELAAEVPSRHVRAAGERLDVQRLRVLPVDPIADAAQPREITQVLRRGRSARHRPDRAT
jgi:hypothetical protein